MSNNNNNKSTRYASLYKNLQPSVLANLAYVQRRLDIEKAAAKAASIKAAEVAIAARITAIKAAEEAYRAAEEAAAAEALVAEYEDYDPEYEAYVDYMLDQDYDW
jgi:hypothetical protein